MTAQRNLSVATNRLEDNFGRLSSGLRIRIAADDAAGLGLSERMRGQIRSLAQASRNAQDGVSFVQTAEGALNEVNANLIRMRELALQASNGVLSPQDIQVIAIEFGQLISEIDRIAVATDFNDIPLLDGSLTSVSFQVGASTGTEDSFTIAMVDTTLSGLALTGQDITTDPLGAIDAIDAAVNSVTVARGTLGAAQNRLQSTIRSIANYRENLSAAESRIRDVDVAFETADLTRNSIVQQAAVSVLTQANAQPQLALQLLQG